MKYQIREYLQRANALFALALSEKDIRTETDSIMGELNGQDSLDHKIDGELILHFKQREGQLTAKAGIPESARSLGRDNKGDQERIHRFNGLKGYETFNNVYYP